MDALPLTPLRQSAEEAAAAFPALLAAAQSLSASVATGHHGRRRSGVGERFWQYRDYAAGDPAARIDWRQSARSPRRLFVRETEWETAATVRLWVSGAASLRYGSEAGVPTKAFRAQTLGVATAILLSKAGERFGPLPAEGPAQSGPLAIERLGLAFLAQQESPDDLPPLPPKGTTRAIYLSDFHLPLDALAAQMRAIAGSGVLAHYVQISDPAEETFPFSGRIDFLDPGTGKGRYRADHADSLREAYGRARTAHRAAFGDLCTSLGATRLTHATDRPPGQVLSALYEAVSADGER